jgi:hypothetical protein
VKHRIALCAGLAALGVACATSAQAQGYVEPPRGYVEPPPEVEQPMVRPMFQPRLAPNEVLMIVRASGLRPLTQPAVRGSNYVLLASDNMGGQLRVMINGNNGRIMNAVPAYDPRFAYHPVRPRGLVPGAPQHAAAPPPSYVPPPSDLKEPSAPPARVARTAPQTPPATSGSSSSLASAPDVTGSVPSRPARTPLPRPRPPEASQQAAASAPAPQATTTPAVRETSPEAEQPAAAPTSPAASTAPAHTATETQMVPVAPLE